MGDEQKWIEEDQKQQDIYERMIDAGIRKALGLGPDDPLPPMVLKSCNFGELQKDIGPNGFTVQVHITEEEPTNQ